MAFEVAARRAAARPPVEAPKPLRPLLGHARLTPHHLAIVRQVLEADADFRHLLAVADEATVGRAGVLFAARPDGWEAELGDLVAASEVAAGEEAGAAEERRATKRLRHAEAARVRADEARIAAEAAIDAVRADLATERRARREADDQAERTARQLDAAGQQRDAARRKQGAADAEADRLRGALAALEAEVAALHERLAVADAEAAAAHRHAASMAAAPADGPPPGGVGDPAALGAAIHDASRAARSLGHALAEAAAALTPAGPAAAAAEVTAPPRRSRGAARLGRHRRPARLPGFVFEESAEAAEHLVRLRGATLLVDGYNASISTWPSLAIADQRHRLVGGLTELAARTGIVIEVVFDGAEGVGQPGPARVRQAVRVSFSPADVEADDILIERSAHLPLPVIVASDDKRVRLGAARNGANLLTVEQLLSVIRRSAAEPGSPA